MKAQSKAWTAAEVALREGISYPDALLLPAARPDFAEHLRKSGHPAPALSKSARIGAHAAAGSFGSSAPSPTELGRYNFEEKAPWYLYRESESGAPGRAAGAAVVRFFNDSLIQINTRQISAKLPEDKLPGSWSQQQRNGIFLEAGARSPFISSCSGPAPMGMQKIPTSRMQTTIIGIVLDRLDSTIRSQLGRSISIQLQARRCQLLSRCPSIRVSSNRATRRVELPGSAPN